MFFQTLLLNLDKVKKKLVYHFFELMDYQVHMCPFKWEGEADLKYLYDNVYIGGYGIRSDIQAYEWMEENLI